LFRWLRTQHDPAFRNLVEWPGDKTAELRMPWAPFHDDAGKLPEETIESDHSVVVALLRPLSEKETTTSCDYVWRDPRSAFLRVHDDEDDEEIEQLFPPRATESALMALVRKRKRDLAGNDTDGLGNHLGTSTNLGPQYDLPGLQVPDGDATATSLVNQLMELRAPNKRLKVSPFFFNMAPEIRPQLESSMSKDKENAETPSDASVSPPPVPSIDPSSTPPTVVLAISLSRTIRRHLQRLLPNLTFIDRDFNAYNHSIWLPGSVCRTEVASPLADEADIVVSPSTGIFITSMIKVRQRPLTAHNNANFVRKKIERIALRYERLIVLVSEGADTGGVTTPSDAKAFAELQGFSGSLDTDVVVQYVGGGEENIAKYAAWTICHAEEVNGTERALVEAESFWEKFLRRAGLNVYAAQTVLGVLKVPDDLNDVGDTSGRYGLSAFVRMPLEQRVALFEGVFGGSRVLERVSDVLDLQW
jgi:hypothetical protein